MDLNRLLFTSFQTSDSPNSSQIDRYLPHLPSLAPEMPTQDIQIPTLSPEKEIARGDGGFSTPKPQRSSYRPRESSIKSSSGQVVNIFQPESLDTEEQEFQEFRNCLMQLSSEPGLKNNLQKENIVPTSTIQASAQSEVQSLAQHSLEVFFDKLHLRLHKNLHEELTSRNLLQSECGTFVRAKKQQIAQELGEQIDTLEAYMEEFNLAPDTQLPKLGVFSAATLTKPYHRFGNAFMQQLSRLRTNSLNRLEQRMFDHMQQTITAAVKRAQERVMRLQVVVGDNSDASDAFDPTETDSIWIHDMQVALDKVNSKVNTL